MDNQKVLLLAPPYMNIYKDIISCLETMGYDVTWIEDGQIKGNPYNKKDINRHTKTPREYDRDVTDFWKGLFESKKTIGFSYFIAIDGLMVSNSFFSLLAKNNPGIKKVLYLYDRIENNYELDCFFHYYDSVFTFDRSDSKKYRINHLPIYWVPAKEVQEDKYDIFGMASYNSVERYEIFKKIRAVSLQNALREYIRLWHPPVANPLLYYLKYVIGRVKGRKMLSLFQLRDEIFTDKVLSTEEFRKTIYNSKAVLDTHTPYQDGLTARFMWALGAERKIITTNGSIKEYSFYDPNQVFVLKNVDEDINSIHHFLSEPYAMKDSFRSIISQYRIDNWLKMLLAK